MLYLTVSYEEGSSVEEHPIYVLLHLPLLITERDREIVEFHWHQTWRLLNLFSLHFLLLTIRSRRIIREWAQRGLSFYDGLL